MPQKAESPVGSELRAPQPQCLSRRRGDRCWPTIRCSSYRIKEGSAEAEP